MRTVLGIGVPDEWSIAPLKHVTSVLNRGSAPNYVDDGPVRVVSQGSNQAAGLDWSRTRFHEFSGDPKRIKGALRPGDVLVNSTGTGTLGRVGYFDKAPDELPCMADGHVTVVRARSDELDSRFAFYWLSSKIFYEYTYAALIVGATNQIELNRDRLGDAPIPLPSLGEQRRIAEFLDVEAGRVDALIDAELRAVDLLVERRSAGVQFAISGGTHSDRRDSKLAWIDSLPEAWQEVHVGLLARMGSGHTPSRSRPDWWVDCKIPWITTGEVKQIRDDRVEVVSETREKISELGLANSAAELHQEGTVFLCRTASAGYSGVMGTRMATSQDFVTWSCGPKLNPYYLLWCLRAMRSDLLGRLAMGSTHKTIYVPDLQMLRIPLPPLMEQGEIVDSVRRQNRRVDVLMDKVRRQIELLKERRQSLITAAVTGQFDVSTASGRNVTDGVTP
ncbi:restriction endonuclease subunit S [Streptomyces acidiscabies]|uniref:restriction endonuclease subunit S n=1 Tax=Streptomyces acidiscabies TaxID=42234 RepID=UPI00099C0C34|nr:restriction endonuclease subunit S [Streptomyces acidiscabies]